MNSKIERQVQGFSTDAFFSTCTTSSPTSASMRLSVVTVKCTQIHHHHSSSQCRLESTLGVVQPAVFTNAQWHSILCCSTSEKFCSPKIHCSLVIHLSSTSESLLWQKWFLIMGKLYFMSWFSGTLVSLLALSPRLLGGSCLITTTWLASHHLPRARIRAAELYRQEHRALNKHLREQQGNI